MPKLFIALDLPELLTDKLAGLQPKPMTGMRLVHTSQMHLTLHYIGEASSSQIASSLNNVDASPFELMVEGAGRFISIDGSITLWAGVKRCRELMELHTRIGDVLKRQQFQLEERPYSPHVTLARYEPHMPSEPVIRWLSDHESIMLPPDTLKTFSLYSSKMVDGIPTYQRHNSFQLAPQ
jgi:2'-5' RNA ligase